MDKKNEFASDEEIDKNITPVKSGLHKLEAEVCHSVDGQEEIDLNKYDSMLCKPKLSSNIKNIYLY